uniref:Uncharacterized protein n=1 Tax=viral metagenome TaxID=1070528 RepID=A0A6C0CS43_9ZZZZ
MKNSKQVHRKKHNRNNNTIYVLVVFVAVSVMLVYYYYPQLQQQFAAFRFGDKYSSNTAVLFTDMLRPGDYVPQAPALTHLNLPSRADSLLWFGEQGLGLTTPQS